MDNQPETDKDALKELADEFKEWHYRLAHFEYQLMRRRGNSIEDSLEQVRANILNIIDKASRDPV